MTYSFLTASVSKNVYIRFIDTRSSGWDAIQVKNVLFVDLTQWFGSSSAIPADLLSDPSLLITKYYNGDLSYNLGELIDSKPTKIINHGFNIWNEQWEIGRYNNTTGAKEPGNSDRIRNKTPIEVLPNTTYYRYYKGLSTNTNIYYYDKNNNFIGFETISNTFTTPSNCAYICFFVDSTYGTTYNHDICINLSNATLNGTYKPYIAPSEYTLDTPTYRSAGSVQDTNKKVNIGVVDLSTLHWTYSNNQYSTVGIQTLVKKPSSSAEKPNAISSKYIVVADSGSLDGQMYIGTSGTLYLRDLSQSGTPIGILFYELATPTYQPSTTLPENMSIEQGGSVEIQYDSNNNAPSDMTFEFATNKLA